MAIKITAQPVVPRQIFTGNVNHLGELPVQI